MPRRARIAQEDEIIATGDSAADFLPTRNSLKALRDAARSCKGCDLYARGTQTVFGEGLLRARVMLVGEQPGDREDRTGRPFVGPAGGLLDRALEDAGIARDDAYVTNVVKHFRWVMRGKRRIHKKPQWRQVTACLPWLEKEIDVVRPLVVVCLGATAAQALLGRDFRVTKRRGQLIAQEPGPVVLATVHPSSILRAPTDEDRRSQMMSFVRDLRVVARHLARAEENGAGARESTGRA